MSYVYIRSEPTLWTVGFYNPDGYRVGLERGVEVALMWFAPTEARERARTDIVRAELATHQA